MPRNGSGTYSTTVPPPFTAGTAIKSAEVNAALADIAAALTASIASDGQTTPTANLPMGARRHTGVGNAAARDDYAAAGQVQDGSLLYVADSGAADVYVATLAPAPTAYAVGMMVRTKIANTNTGASTINVNGLGAKAIRKNGAAATVLAAGDLVVGDMAELIYDGTYFQLLNAPSQDKFKAGMIVMWSGSIASIPAGWALCDGTNGTPNLEDKFVVGAGNTYAVADTGGAVSVSSDSQGAHTHTVTVDGTALTVAQLPAHGHPFRMSTSINATSQSDATGGFVIVDTGSGGTLANYAAFTGTPSSTAGEQIGGAGSGSTHDHTASTASNGAHTHTVATLPPYYALAFIMKL